MSETILHCGSYTVEMDVGTSTNKFILDDLTAGVLDGVLYVLDGTPDWRDVTGYVMDTQIERGRKSPFQEESGAPATCRLLIKNDNFHFSAFNTASPYWNSTTNRLGFEKGTGVRVSREGQYLFYGSITSLPETIMKPKRSSVTVNASDDLFKANNVNVPAQAVVAERSDQRLIKVLDSVNMFAGIRDIDVGLGNLGTAPIDGSATLLDYLGRINNSERGRIFISRSGRFTMHKRIGYIQSNIIAVLSDDGVNIGYEDFEMANN